MNLGQKPIRCLVTGASGFIGGRLCGFLSTAGVPYVPLVRSKASAAAFAERGVTAAVGDLLNLGKVKSALVGCDAIVHLAQGGQGPLATRLLVEWAVAAQVKCFVHVSSMAVHGPEPGLDAICEETARIGRYDHEYSDSKAEQEEIVQAAIDRGDLQAIILRPTIVYGPGSHFVMQIIEQARQGVVTWFDEGVGICNAVYIDDVCDAIKAALMQPSSVGQHMFINGDASVSWREFIRVFAEMVSPRPRFENLSAAQASQYWKLNPPPVHSSGFLPRVVRKITRFTSVKPEPAPWPSLGRVQREMVRVTFNNDKAKRLLDWSPKTNFETGAALTRSWLEQAGHLR